MKRILIIGGTALVSLLFGCSTTPVVVGPVGPDPYGVNDQSRNGRLEVFSALAGRTEGNNPTWFQHADYRIYNPNGGMVKYVGNVVGYYANRPRTVSLPPGRYFVEAQAKDYLMVKVPVVIKTGQITKVHLDDAWRPADIGATALVRLPAGDPVGWSANAR